MDEPKDDKSAIEDLADGEEDLSPDEARGVVGGNVVVKPKATITGAGSGPSPGPVPPPPPPPPPPDDLHI